MGAGMSELGDGEREREREMLLCTEGERRESKETRGGNRVTMTENSCSNLLSWNVIPFHRCTQHKRITFHNSE